MLNRAALIVRPAAPYLQWALSLDDSGIVPDPAGEQTVYLVPPWRDSEGAKRILASVWPDVFERELKAWHIDESAWPPKRTLKMFKQWFRIEMHSMVEDLGRTDLEDDEA